MRKPHRARTESPPVPVNVPMPSRRFQKGHATTTSRGHNFYPPPGAAYVYRYLRTSEIGFTDNGVDEDCETSGATSGEEIWGTPTSGGDDSYNYDGQRSPNDGSVSSENGDDTELMMDELLMTPPVSAATIRGLLPRRTLEPLMEEDSDTYTTTESTASSSSSTPTEKTPSSKQGIDTGSAADIYSTVAGPETTIRAEPSSTAAPAYPDGSKMPKIHRSDSYRHIIDQEDEDATFFSRFRANTRIINIERIPKSRGVKLLEIFNVKRYERKIHQSSPGSRQLIRVFMKEGAAYDEVPTSLGQKPFTTKVMKDKQMDRRFWKQLSKRRGSKCANTSA